MAINEAESIKWFKKSAAQNIGSAKGELVLKDNAESIAIIDEFITKIEKNIPGAEIYLVETPQSKTSYYNPNIQKLTQAGAMSSTSIVLVGLTHPLLSENKIFVPNKMAITIGSTTYEQPFEMRMVNNVIKYTLTMGNMLEIRNYFYKKRYSKYFLDPSITVSSKADWAVFFAVVKPGIPRDDIFVTEEEIRDKTIKDNMENKKLEKNKEYETQKQKIKEELISIGEERERKKKNR